MPDPARAAIIAASTLGLATLAAGHATAAEASPWLVRVRALHLDPADKSDPVGGAGAANRLTLGLQAAQVQTPSGRLSGGERLKAALACALWRKQP
eukprot:gene44878-55852_t